MKFFTPKDSFENKINFVDYNNVLVGYDTSCCCCEDADWFLSYSKDVPYTWDSTKNTELENKTEELEKYIFDTNFFESIEEGEYDAGGKIIFKLTAEGLEDIYLHIYNAHNGYYGHGFESSINGIDWENGYL